VTPFSEEQLRSAANLAQFYDAWLSAERKRRALPYGMAWKRSGEREYLYELRDRLGNGKSLGPRNADTEARYRQYQDAKAAAAKNAEGAGARVAETGRILRALRAPAISSSAAAVLREADALAMLGTDLIAVGTVAMIAYQYEAAQFFAAGLDATEDFDLAWTGGRGMHVALAYPPAISILALLKAVDPTYTVNTERPFQARNKDAYEVELLIAPSVAGTLPRSEPLRPEPLPEQEWLLRGSRLEQVVPASDASAARIVAPDPRWYALHKLWLAEKPARSALKRPKDRRQGEALLRAIRAVMPRFPIDDAFVVSLPEELRGYVDTSK
jgi:hypothetical protein